MIYSEFFVGELFAFEILWAITTAVMICKLDWLKWKFERIERKLGVDGDE